MLVERLGDRLVIGSARIGVPVRIGTEWAGIELNLPKLLFGVARIAIESGHVYPGILKPPQIAHVILIGVGDKQIVDTSTAQALSYARACRPVLRTPRIDHRKSGTDVSLRSYEHVLEHGTWSVLNVPDTKAHFPRHGLSPQLEALQANL